jgi:hypothetical protein
MNWFSSISLFMIFISGNFLPSCEVAAGAGFRANLNPGWIILKKAESKKQLEELLIFVQRERKNIVLTPHPFGSHLY